MFIAYDKNNGKEVVVKVEKIGQRRFALLDKEYQFCQKLLTSPSNAPEFVHIIQRIYDMNYHCLVMERCGHNIEQLFKICNYKFSMKTILMLVDEMFSKVTRCHLADIIHRDIKPENFVMGFDGERSKHVYLIDFNLAAEYKKNGNHIDKCFVNPTGNYCFLSVNAHQRIVQTRRDDMEALAYTLIYLAKGKLPWKGIKWGNGNDRETMRNEIYYMKMSTPVDVICEGLPDVFKEFLFYCRRLKFDETPDYSFWRNQFRKLYFKEGYKYDYQYDWIINDDIAKKLKQQKQLIDLEEFKKIREAKRKTIENWPTESWSTKNWSTKNWPTENKDNLDCNHNVICWQEF